MRAIFTLLIALTLVYSCQDNSETYILEGDAIGYADGTQIQVQAYSFKERFSKIIDTLIVQDEKFSGTYPASKEQTLSILRIENERAPVLFFTENKNLKATIEKDSIHKWHVKGGKLNDAKVTYDQAIYKFNQDRQKLMDQYTRAQQNNDEEAMIFLRTKDFNLDNEESEFRRDFLKKQPKSLLTLMILEQTLRNKEVTGTYAYEYIDSMDAELANSPLALTIKATAETMRKAEIGVKAPEFSGPTPDGGTLALSEALGKYTIIDFWASWCKPCRVENPNVVAAYKKYHDKGLNIISVSLDRENEKEKWLKAIEDDGLDWYHISHLKFWSDPIIGDYNVQAIPATFLLDENGIIIDKDLRGAALHAKLETLFADL